jgi:nucleotide-binding universal stress UspA family protein
MEGHAGAARLNPTDGAEMLLGLVSAAVMPLSPVPVMVARESQA